MTKVSNRWRKAKEDINDCDEQKNNRRMSEAKESKRRYELKLEDEEADMKILNEDYIRLGLIMENWETFKKANDWSVGTTK